MDRLLTIILITFLMTNCNKNNESFKIVKNIIQDSSTKENNPINKKIEFIKNHDTLIFENKGCSLSDFIPNSWELIDLDTGYLSPFKNPVIITGLHKI